GLLLWVLFGNPAGILFVAIAAFTLLEWRFPIFDHWFDRRRLVVGSSCEMWLDESGLRYHQTGSEGAFETTGHVGWSAMTAVREDDQILLVVGGRAARAGIPKRAFGSSEALAALSMAVWMKLSPRKRQFNWTR